MVSWIHEDLLKIKTKIKEEINNLGQDIRDHKNKQKVIKSSKKINKNMFIMRAQECTGKI
jgi:hypothetical protein